MRLKLSKGQGVLPASFRSLAWVEGKLLTDAERDEVCVKIGVNNNGTWEMIIILLAEVYGLRMRI